MVIPICPIHSVYVDSEYFSEPKSFEALTSTEQSKNSHTEAIKTTKYQPWKILSIQSIPESSWKLRFLVSLSFFVLLVLCLPNAVYSLPFCMLDKETSY